MLLIGCTGGIGSGKSTFAAMLGRRGAVVLDADRIAKEVLEPGRTGFDEAVAHFGSCILGPDGTVDRARLAAIVFADPAQRRALEAIVHPLVHESLRAAIAAERDGDRVVVLDVPLLVESGNGGRYDLDGMIVVDAPEDVALERLLHLRKMAEGDARARMAAQASRPERLARADFIVLNIGTLSELDAMAEQAWAWIGGLRANPGQTTG